ncbi:coiled-coil domain-containing protein 42 homolog [Copidosoma floridanum]|uniref:coiled-coil domain-containing protein 42 homolog n=1 Tax=Copidosoma floridanum TaxID=29053 RepID=UPI0006C9D05C|nr:coiled-coil domain-containing protein 42 homolog [Copidosoma floridanum]
MASKERVLVKKRPPIASDFNKAIAEYFSSKKEEQATVIKHYPEWDDVRGEPLIDQARARRELLIAEAELQAKRLEYQARRQSYEQQWQDLREQEQQLRASFVHFDEFVRENRDKRERAERKIVIERDRQKIREAEILELDKNLENMEKVRDKMKRYVEVYRPFQGYLEKILENKEFNSIAGIFNRYEVLVAARNSLEDYQNRNLRTLETTSSQLQKMTEEKSQSLMDLNRRLAQLRDRHERARAKAVHWETMVSRIKDVCSQKELEETQVRACIWNLYRQICRRKGVPIELDRSELEEQLHHVKRTILELGKIVHAAKKKTAREKREREAKGKAGANAGTASSLSTGAAIKLKEVRSSSKKNSCPSSTDDTHSTCSIFKKN